jgi:hypothetical protein
MPKLIIIGGIEIIKTAFGLPELVFGTSAISEPEPNRNKNATVLRSA